MANRFYAFVVVFMPAIVPDVAHADAWTTQDTVFQLAYTGLNIFDLLNTSTTARDGHTYGNSEINLILGEHPSHLEINAYFAVSSLAQYGIARVLPHPWRTYWQMLSIGVKSGMVGYNLYGGVQMSLPW
jgi:hypothetical protein